MSLSEEIFEYSERNIFFFVFVVPSLGWAVTIRKGLDAKCARWPTNRITERVASCSGDVQSWVRERRTATKRERERVSSTDDTLVNEDTGSYRGYPALSVIVEYHGISKVPSAFQHCSTFLSLHKKGLAIAPGHRHTYIYGLIYFFVVKKLISAQTRCHITRGKRVFFPPGCLYHGERCVGIYR